jgi:hypothetical protein
MIEKVLDKRNSVLNLRKIFWLLVSFEAFILMIFLVGDYFLYNNLLFYVYCAGILITPSFSS